MTYDQIRWCYKHLGHWVKAEKSTRHGWIILVMAGGRFEWTDSFERCRQLAGY